MSTTLVKRPETPGGVGMFIYEAVPTDFNGNALDGQLATTLLVQSAGGAGVTPQVLTTAGITAMLAAINTYVAGLTATKAAQIQASYAGSAGGSAYTAGAMPAGGLSVAVTRNLVTVPCAPGDAGTLATSLAAVLAGGNLTVGV